MKTNDTPPDPKPLVSVIMPFLNMQKFIQEAIESVFAQTYDNWELLLIDDGSTDCSTEIAHRYTQQYPERVRYLAHVAHQNRGLSASRNLGVSHAKGEYIALLDADDIWLPQKLERQVAILQTYSEAAMTYGPGQWWYSWTDDPGDGARDFLQNLDMPLNTLFQPPALLIRFLRQESVGPLTCALLIRRHVIERIGGWEDAFTTLHEDQAFRAKVCLAAPVFVESECYCRYRKHPDSLCAVMKRTGQRPAARQIFLNWLEMYMSQQRVQDDEVWAALREELSPYRQPALRRLWKHAKHCAGQAMELIKLVARLALPVSMYQGLKAHRDRLLSPRRAS